MTKNIKTALYAFLVQCIKNVSCILILKPHDVSYGVMALHNVASSGSIFVILHHWNWKY